MSIAISYARALYEVAQEAGASSVAPSLNTSNVNTMDQLEVQMDRVTQLLTESEEVRIVLVGPITTTREKEALVEEFSKVLGLSPLLTQFLNLLVRKRRLYLLKEMREAFNTIRLTAEGGVAARLETAEAISETDVSQLAKALGEKIGKKVAFRVSTDPSLLAGIKVTVNGVTYDGTLRSQIQKLRDRVISGLPQVHA